MNGFAGRIAVVLAILCLALPVAAQNTVVGVVTAHSNGQPVANATVSVEGTKTTATTNGVGRFRLDGVSADRTLIIEAPGFLKLRIPSAAAGPLDIELEATPNMLEHIQVTATKEPVSVGDVAAQADIIDRSVIEERGDQSLTQAITHVPGAILSTELGIFESVMLRGMPRGDPEFTNILVMIDGVPQTLSNNGARVVALPINDASSIEVVRGPNSALYGRTAIGGSVNVRTPDPSPEHHVTFDFTAGQFDTLKGVAKVTGPVKQWGSYYISAASERNHGFYKSTSDYNDGNSAQFAKFTFAPGHRSYGSISFDRVISDNSTPTNEPIINGQFLHLLDPRFNRLTNFNIPGPNYHQSEGRFTLNYGLNLTPWAKVSETFGYRNVQQKFINDGDFLGSPYDLSTRLVTMYPFSQQLDEDIFYQEARLELTPHTGRVKHSLSLGGSYEWNRGTLSSDFIFTDSDSEGFPIDYLNPVIPPIGDWQHDTGTPRLYHLGITGLFGQYTVQPVNRLIFTAAGRYDRLKLDNTRGTAARINDTFDAFSPKGSVTVKLLGSGSDARHSLNLYGAYSQAFLPPRRASSLIPDDVPLNLKPENIENYETGLKGSLLGGKVGLEATYFQMRENGVVLTRREGPRFFPTNSGQLRYKGVETGATVKPSSKLSMYLNASFYRNRFGTFVIQSEDGDETLTANKLPTSPNYVVNWGATFTPVHPVDITLNVKHIGMVFTDQENTFTLPQYSLVDAAITLRHGPLRYTLSGRNLLNKEYYWNAGSETADPGAPRQVLATVSVTF